MVTPELVCLAGCVVSSHHRKTHYLFLKEGHTERLFQNRNQARVRVLHGFLTAPAAEIRMHHSAHDGPGPHDADLDHKVVKVSRLHPREHGHLRPALDLKGTQGIGPGDHLESLSVTGWDGGHGNLHVPVVLEEAETPVHLCESSQTQEIYFEKPQILQVLLVPLDNGTIGHAPVLDRNNVAHGFMA